jgi:hypothetical protein
MSFKKCIHIAAIISAAIFIFTGCIHLPNPAGDFSPVPGPSHPALNTDKLLPPAPAPGDTATHAVQTTVNWLAWLMGIAGIAGMALGGFAIYGGRLWVGVRLLVIGVSLPIAGIYFAFHWKLILGLLLLGVGLYEVVMHWSVISPFAKKVQSVVVPEVESAAEKIAGQTESVAAPLAKAAEAKIVGYDKPAPGFAVTMPGTHP